MIADALAQEIGTLDGLMYSASVATGTNVFVENLPQTPDLAVAVYEGDGPEADSLHAYDAPEPQVIVRSAPNSPAGALVLWQTIYSHLHGLRNVDLPDGTHLVYMLAVRSSPARLGPDEEGRQRYALDLRCEIINVTEHRTWQGAPES